MRRLIRAFAKLLYGTITWGLAIVLLVLGAVFWLLALPWRGLRWLELWAVYDGDRNARERAEWKADF